MVLDTRGVFALAAGLLMTAGVVASLRGRDVLASKVMTVAFGLGTLWATMSVAWAGSNESALTQREWLMFATMGVAATVYYGLKAANGVGFTERFDNT